MSTSKALRDACEQRNTQLLAEAIPFIKAMGIQFTQEENQLVGQMHFARQLVGDIAGGALHGGSIGSLLESTAIFSLLWERPDTQMPETINLTVDYLQPGRPKLTYADAAISHHGRQVAKVCATAWQEDRTKPIAVAHAHFLLVPSS